MRRLSALAVATGVALALMTAGPSTGTAAAGELKTACSPWSGGRTFQTSTRWGRVSQRVCIEWFHNQDQVMPVTYMRLDWPSECPLDFACPLVNSKRRVLDFEEISMNVSWDFAGRTGTDNETRTETGDMGWGNGNNGFDEHIWAIRGPWLTHPLGTYVVTGSIGVNINDDGGGKEYFEPQELRLAFGPA